jgi:hypothetical protein
VAAGGPACAPLEVDDKKCKEFGLDLAATDAFAAIEKIKTLIKERKMR